MCRRGLLVVMMTITVEDYENQYWPKLQGAITQLLTMTPGDYIPISYEQMYRYVAQELFLIGAGTERVQYSPDNLTLTNSHAPLNSHACPGHNSLPLIKT